MSDHMRSVMDDLVSILKHPFFIPDYFCLDRVSRKMYLVAVLYLQGKKRFLHSHELVLD